MSSESNEIVGVILAAGKGSRMSQLPTRLPKTVLPVMGEPIVYHQLRVMAEAGIRRVVIVVGHLGFQVVREIERMPSLGLEIDYVDQKETLGIAHCVGLLERRIDRPFLLCLGDIYFEAPRIDEMIFDFERKPEAAGVLGAIHEKDVEAIRKNFCIVADNDGRAVQVIEKPRHPRSQLKGVGIYLFAPQIFDAIRRTPRTAMRDEYEITEAIQVLIDDGVAVGASACIDQDINLTFPADLLNCNLLVARDLPGQALIDDSAAINADARVERSVVGSGAQIVNPIVVRRSLVLEGSVVDARTDLDGFVIGPTTMVDCKHQLHE